MKLFSPAKINLLLNVVRKRKDGYHELETVFERLDLGDFIVLKKIRTGIILRTQGQKVPSNRTNTAYRAASLLKDRYHVRQGVHISIEKNIPVAAGLGGGSSNAATVLLGLNRLWKLGLSRARLMKLGAKIGSDVPFFVMQSPFALGAGRGEILRKISAPGRKLWHVLIKPPFGISTKEAYHGFSEHALGRNRARLTLPKTGVRMLLHSIRKGDTKVLAGLLTNSLEVTLNKRVTIILKLKKMLLASGALGVLMSGSGSTVFGVFESRSKAADAARNLRKKNRNWKVFVAGTY